MLALCAAVAVLSSPVVAQTPCQDDASFMYGGSDSPDNCHVLGGNEQTNNLRIFVADGLLGTQRYEGGGWQHQFYTYSGALVIVDGQKTSLGYYTDADDPTGGWGSTSSYEAPDSQSKSGNTVTTVWTVDGLRIVQRVTLSSSDDKFYRIDWDIQNQGGSAANVAFLRGEDTYLAGGDFGIGFWNDQTNTVGVTKTQDGTQQRLSYTAITDPAGYRSADYSNVIQDVESGSLDNSARQDDHDNGYAMEWRNENLGAGGTWEIRSVEGVVEGSIIVSGGGTNTFTGETETFTFDVSNVGDSTETVEFSTECPATGLTCSTPDSIDIDPDSTRQVDVSVEVENGTAPGSYDVVLAANPVDGDPTEGYGQLVIPSEGSEDDESDDPKVTAFDASAENGTIAVTFESEENPVSLDVAIDGPDAGSLGRDAFSGDVRGGYRATYTPDEGGSYTVTLRDARDRSNGDLADPSVDLTETVRLQAPGTPTPDNGSDEPTATPDDNTTDDGPGDATPTPTTAGTPTPTDGTTASPTDADAAETPTPTDGTTANPTEDDGTGFGGIVALGALTAIALLARRRR